LTTRRTRVNPCRDERKGKQIEKKSTTFRDKNSGEKGVTCHLQALESHDRKGEETISRWGGEILSRNRGSINLLEVPPLSEKKGECFREKKSSFGFVLKKEKVSGGKKRDVLGIDPEKGRKDGSESI